MSAPLRFEWQHAIPFLTPDAIAEQAPVVRAAHEALHAKSGPGYAYTGWLDLPARYDPAEFARIKEAVARIRSDSEALVVIGIGGSYMGARAVIEALGHHFANQLPSARRGAPAIYFAGKEVSAAYLTQLLEVLQEKEVSINMVSKSGTTIEPALAFRVLRAHLERRYGREGARRRIYVTTDPGQGALAQLAQQEGYERFTIAPDVGGRYSVLTAAGLLPIAASGISIDELMAGAADAYERYGHPDVEQNPAYQYAVARNLLHRGGKMVELLVSYEPSLCALTEWWKQLFGESEGKGGKGIFPAGAQFSTDLHSLGQYIQDGARLLFETVLRVEKPPVDLQIPYDEDDIDGLNFLAGKTFDHVNQRVFAGSLVAHTDGGAPNLVVTLPTLTARALGQALYFFQKACALSGYLIGVNPFDQPGVEDYKRNMFALLGRPGFEESRRALESRLNQPSEERRS